ncbi:RNA polymerase sigma factor [Planctomycetes bacterium K23_9]|uniref:RNA polymerase sigma factor n=1 Tax=Stieleria marina TaxID=1930275 RepID=A0A517NQE7_9BACT|nr:RNA polymerase sigma factor [Planctomycetes bacterium K23_9]
MNQSPPTPPNDADDADAGDFDADLVQRIKQRDPQALAELINQNRDRLAGFIRSITGEHLLAVVEIDDLVQEVSATALTSLPTAPMEEYEPYQWLQQIARRRVVDAHRFHFDAQRRDVSRQQSINSNSGGSGASSSLGMEALLSASMTSPSAAVSRDIRMVRMNEAISELSEEQKRAVRMRYAEGKPTKEIAKALGKTDVAIRVLLSRSMRVLEKQLEDVRPTRG